jgi:ribosomal-protein-alanine N-acetyltransferase
MTENTNDGVRIREINASHIGDLIHIGESVNLSPWTAESYLAEMKNPDAVMLRLVSEGNKTVGFIIGRIVGAVGESLLEAEIYNIAVKEREQRKGNGQLLFNAFVESCRSRGVATVWLEVRESNDKAITFYKRNGFERVQQRIHFYEHPREHAWLMRLTMK